MAVDLFSLVLESAASWAIGKFLDTLLECGTCGYKADNSISVQNYDTNNLICPRCGGFLDQYTNATSHTVNRNGSIAAGYISNLHWGNWGGIWQTRFSPTFDINVVNSKYEDVVVKISVSDYDSYNLIYEDKSALKPTYERTVWKDHWWKIPPDLFPKEKIVFAVDLYLLNTWGDELHRTRSLGNWNGRSD